MKKFTVERAFYIVGGIIIAHMILMVVLGIFTKRVEPFMFMLLYSIFLAVHFLCRKNLAFRLSDSIENVLHKKWIYAITALCILSIFLHIALSPMEADDIQCMISLFCIPSLLFLITTLGDSM